MKQVLSKFHIARNWYEGGMGHTHTVARTVEALTEIPEKLDDKFTKTPRVHPK